VSRFEIAKLELKYDKSKAKVKLSIIIQPFEGLPISTTNLVAVQLKEIYSGDIIVNKAIPFPKNALNHNKTRYRADSLIRFLGTLVKDGQLIIGLTNKDISTTKEKYSDWGVMGLGYCPGKSCIASTFRLKGKNRLEKLFKVAIHELGHTQGLARTKSKHCPEKTCLMRDAEGKDHLDELKKFCSKCKPVLINAGWELN
jgi:archaemetzincin